MYSKQHDRTYANHAWFDYIAKFIDDDTLVSFLSGRIFHRAPIATAAARASFNVELSNNKLFE